MVTSKSNPESPNSLSNETESPVGCLTMASFADCIDTREGTNAELEMLETRLGAELGLSGNIREQLLELDRLHGFDHTPLVADWQATYARYLDWEESS